MLEENKPLSEAQVQLFYNGEELQVISELVLDDTREIAVMDICLN